jgi:hypothetical protein
MRGDEILLQMIQVRGVDVEQGDVLIRTLTMRDRIRNKEIGASGKNFRGADGRIRTGGLRFTKPLL